MLDNNHQINFKINFQSSRYRQILAVILAIMLMIGVFWAFFGAMRWILLGLIGLSLYYALIENTPLIQSIQSIQAIIIDENQNAHLLFQSHNHKNNHKNQEYKQAELLAGSLITPYICFLKWRYSDNQIYWQCILPDSINNINNDNIDNFRRLRVWARWCQKK